MNAYILADVTIAAIDWLLANGVNGDSVEPVTCLMDKHHPLGWQGFADKFARYA